VTGPEPSDDAGNPASQGPHWEMRVEDDGTLTAILAGTYPPLTVTGTDLKTLRKNVKAIVMRGML
jgi:hypothetical protein